MKQTYRALFGCYLEHDIAERTFGDHQKVSSCLLLCF
jgi:annexin A7/11